MKYCLYNWFEKPGDFDMDFLVYRIQNHDILSEYHSLPDDIVVSFDSATKKFIDHGGIEIDLTDELIFPISGIDEVEEIQIFAEEKNYKTITAREENHITEYWFNYYFPKRKLLFLKGSELLDPVVIERIKACIGNDFFIKTVKKNYSAIANTSFLENRNSVMFSALLEHLDDEFLISEVVDILSDEIGNLEYRCVVINNQLRNISRITDSVMHSISPEVAAAALSIIEKLEMQGFTKNFTLDLFSYIDKDGEIHLDVLECNALCSSGLYLYNSVVDTSTDFILHENEEKLPFGKAVKEQEKIIPSKYFYQESSFAESVKKFTGAIDNVHSKKSSRRYEDDDCLGDEKKEIDIKNLKLVLTDQDL